ncbi:hypothetical protein SOVF_210360 isoform A [Spinacia oleracea]|nr:hypothetical protein SOVF_210360 isoform A [Spinacia oleracea]
MRYGHYVLPRQAEGLSDEKREAMKGFNKEFDPSSNVMRYGHYVL